ncbi:MAG: GxxExxY protein [Acidobacteria bacterium]|nr:GxxExxY protein [Acidobacteriota bacterium]MBI3656161.1 GxxExxY protein [Acidobacteriota bacterium]
MYGRVHLTTKTRRHNLDRVVDQNVILELKAVEEINPLFEAQLLTYLKLTGKRLGWLVNFNLPLIKDGIKRMVL